MKDEIKELFPNEFYVKKDKKMYAEISLENLNKIDDCITNLQECCKDKIDRYQEMILKYCELQEKYKKSCETYQQALDETMSEKMDLEKENEDLREDNYAYHQLMKMQNKREFRSKFLKEFQEEFGTNTFPDYDEIYKRYDKIKKENERLKAREQECIDKYLNMSKYASEMEGKYITEKYIIDELEKEINNQLNMTRKFDKYNEGYFNATLNYYNKLKELKEGK